VSFELEDADRLTRLESSVTSLVKSIEQLTVLRDEKYDDKLNSFKEGVSLRFAAQEKAVAAAMAASQAAIDKAESAAQRRFEGVNEFRNTLSDQQRTLIPRAEAEVRISAIEKQLDTLRDELTSVRARSLGVAAGWGWAVGVVGIVIAVASFLMSR
jgi:chromosome segregation ATPase